MIRLDLGIAIRGALQPRLILQSIRLRLVINILIPWYKFNHKFTLDLSLSIDLDLKIYKLRSINLNLYIFIIIMYIIYVYIVYMINLLLSLRLYYLNPV